MNVVVGVHGDVATAGGVIDGALVPADPTHRYLRPALTLLITIGGGYMLVPDAPDALLLA